MIINSDENDHIPVQGRTDGQTLDNVVICRVGLPSRKLTL